MGKSGCIRHQRALGAYFTRLAARLDRTKAITATVHKLAPLIYTMLTKGSEYADKGQDYYEERYRQRVMHHLTQRAEKLGFQLVTIQEPAQHHDIRAAKTLARLSSGSTTIQSNMEPLAFMNGPKGPGQISSPIS